MGAISSYPPLVVLLETGRDQTAVVEIEEGEDVEEDHEEATNEFSAGIDFLPLYV